MNYELSINVQGLAPHQQTFNTGGFGISQLINLGKIQLWDANFTNSTTISSIVINSINNNRVDNVNVSLWRGYKTLYNEKNSVNRTEAELSDKAILVSTKHTDINGTFIFRNLFADVYTLVLEKEGFYREIHHINVIGDMTEPIINIPMTPLLEEGKIRFVLSWPDGPKDLDLHALFQINRFSKCEVYFGKRDCVGTELDTDNIKEEAYGVETLTINTLGNYIYTFGVNKYVDISGGVGQGDNPIPGVNNSTRVTNDSAVKVPDYPLSESRAKISVYINGYKGPIYQIQVPIEDPNSVIDQKDNTDPRNWWIAFCLDGKRGLDSLKSVNKLSSYKPNFTYCETLYAPKPTTFAQMTKLKKRQF